MKMKLLLLILVLFLFLCPNLDAGSVQQVSFEDLVKASEFVFSGRVVDTRAARDARGMIETRVTFEVLEVLKGRFTGKRITLSFLGGTVGGSTLQIADLVPPRMGERGVYFVESVAQPTVHPLYGWDQGHFLIEEGGDGIDRILSRDRKTIAGFERSARASGISSGIAAGLIVRESSALQQGVTVTEFKDRIRGILNTR